MRELEGKNAIITGANRGLGRAVTEKLMAQGANVFAVVRKKESFSDAEKLEQLYGTKITLIECDLADEEAVKTAAREILSFKVPIYLLVNNAGVMFSDSVLNMTTMSRIKEAYQINFFSPLLLTQLISKSMIKNKSGNIIFVSSSAAFDAGSNVEYCSSKAAVVCAAKRLAVEYGGFGIRVNTVCPGPIDTDMGNAIGEKLITAAMENNIMKRMATPNEVAEAILFLASERSAYITGQVMRVDGRIN